MAHLVRHLHHLADAGSASGGQSETSVLYHRRLWPGCGWQSMAGMCCGYGVAGVLRCRRGCAEVLRQHLARTVVATLFDQAADVSLHDRRLVIADGDGLVPGAGFGMVNARLVAQEGLQRGHGAAAQ